MGLPELLFFLGSLFFPSFSQHICLLSMHFVTGLSRVLEKMLGVKRTDLALARGGCLAPTGSTPRGPGSRASTGMK